MVGFQDRIRMSSPAAGPAPSDPLAEAAVASIQSGMIVGLGTGRAASRAVRALVRRVQAERLEVRGVPTSRETEALARAGGLEILDLRAADRIDFLFDGADEVDERLRMLKGGHGALVAERLAASIAGRRVYLVQAEKLVKQLGARAELPIAVLPEAEGPARAGLVRLGLRAELRRTPAGELFRADAGHLVMDARIGERDAAELAAQLDRVPGVVDHGLFIDECEELLIESGEGPVQRRIRGQ